MRNDLTTKNIETAKDLGITVDESIERVNNRLWSENAWRQEFVLGPIVFAFCDQLSLNADDLNEAAQFRLAAFIKGLYDGAQQSWARVKIKN